MATYAFTINAVSKQFQINSLDIREVLHGTDTMLCDVVSATGSYRPTLFHELALTENGTTIFAGYIDDVEETGAGGIPGSGANPINLRISAVGYNTVASWVHVTETIASGGTLKAALQVLDDYLPSGFALHASQTNGPTLTEDLDWDGVLLSDALNQLHGMTGWFWRIDNDKKLRMMEPGTDAAPFDVTTANRKAIGDVRVKRSRQNFANRIIVKYGQGVITGKTDTFTGNGSTTKFFLNYQAVYQLNVFIGYGYVSNQGVNETLSFSGGGGTWVYDPADNSITRTSAPANGNAISITYDAQFPATVTVEDTGAQPPVITRVVVMPAVFDVAVATAIADSLLAKGTTDQKTVEYQTYDMGIHPGHSQEIDLPNRDLTTDDVLVTEVTTRSTRATQTDHQVIRTVRAEVGTSFYGSWRDVYRDWLNTGGGTTVLSGTMTGPGPAPSFGSNVIHSCTGHPQGQVVAPVSHLCIRTDNGALYRKLGGASSAYGWYEVLTMTDHAPFGVWASANSVSTATVGAIGIGTALTGTLSAVTGSSSGYYGNVARLTTASSINSNASIRQSGGASVNVGNEFDLVAVIRTSSDITSQRIWIGLDENGGTFNNGDTPAAGFARYAFRFSTAASDTGWRGQVSDGTTTNTTSNMGTVAASTRYILRIRGDREVSGGDNETLYFSVNNGTEVTLAGVPVSDEQMEWGMSIYNLVASTREFDFERFMVYDGVGLNENL